MLRLEPGAYGATSSVVHSARRMLCGEGLARANVAGCIVLLVGQRNGVRRDDWLRCRCAVLQRDSVRGPLGCGKRESERAMALTRIGQDGPLTIVTTRSS